MTTDCIFAVRVEHEVLSEALASCGASLDQQHALPPFLRSADLCELTVHLVGSWSGWREDQALQMSRQTVDGQELYVSRAVPLPTGEACSFRFLLKRREFVADWETIPPPARVVCPPPATTCPFRLPTAEYGRLPESHPKFRGGSSVWRDAKWLTPALGSEIRVCFGTYKMRSAIRGQALPVKFSIQMRWGSSAEENAQSLASGGNIQATVGRLAETEEAVHSRELELLTRNVLQSAGEWTTFRFHADLASLEKQFVHPVPFKQYSGQPDPVAKAYIPLSTFTRVDLRHGPGADGSRISRGSFTVPLFSTTRVGDCGGVISIGEIFAEFLVVDPFVHPKCTLEYVWRRYWTGHKEGRGTLDVGHRGCGRWAASQSRADPSCRSYKHVVGQDVAEVRENTIFSFTQAGFKGAEYVELDVMLTKDRVPIIFHDFSIGIMGETLSRTPKSSPVLSPRQRRSKTLGSLPIPISELTLQQLKMLRTTGLDSDEFGSFDLNKGIPPRCPSFDDLSKRAEENQRHSLESMGLAVPTLEEILTQTPDWLGLNIEIKYPVLKKVEWQSFTDPFEINSYVDTVLECIFDHASDSRRIVLSCFSPDVCIALMLKQPRYPVCFLSGAGVDPHHSILSDLRCCSLSAAIAFAQNEGLSGIVTNSSPLFYTQEGVQTQDQDLMVGKGLLHAARKRGLLMWTWGDDNNDVQKLELQKSWGVDAVICDNVDKLANKRSLFHDVDLWRATDLAHQASQAATRVEETNDEPRPVSPPRAEPGALHAQSGLATYIVAAGLIGAAVGIGVFAAVSSWRSYKTR